MAQPISAQEFRNKPCTFTKPSVPFSAWEPNFTSTARVRTPIGLGPISWSKHYSILSIGLVPVFPAYAHASVDSLKQP